MDSIFQNLIFNVQNEHDFEHAMRKNLQFSTPKIYTAKGDLSKRWYVYFSFRNPETNRMQRMKNIYGIANKFKTKEKRIEVLTIYRRNLIRLLKLGYSPFEDNKELHEDLNNAKQSEQPANFDGEAKMTFSPKKVQKKRENTNVKAPLQDLCEKPANKEKSSQLIKDAVEFALKIKTSQVKERTYKDYKSKTKRFLKWLNTNNPDITHCEDLTRKHFMDFLNEILMRTSPRNRNNHRTELSSVFQVLEDNEIIKQNFLKSIAKLETKPEVHKLYTNEQVDHIYSFLKEEDPVLLLFIKFLGISLMRPIEICRLKVGDLNLEERVMYFTSKTSSLKTKIIPQMLIDELPDLSGIEKTMTLFTPHGIGKVWNASDDSKRGYFSGRFKELVKGKFGLTQKHTLYGFRHTYITQIYQELRKTKTPFETKSELMLITGHKNMKSLEAYLRTIDAELPSDYSNLIQKR